MNPVKESVFNWGLDLSNSRGSYAWLLKPNKLGSRYLSPIRLPRDSDMSLVLPGESSPSTRECCNLGNPLPLPLLNTVAHGLRARLGRIQQIRSTGRCKMLNS